MKTIGSLIEGASHTLSMAGLKNPRLDAECLMAKALEIDRLKLYLSWDHPLHQAAAQSFETLLARRKDGEPLQYLLGYKEFWSLKIKVTPQVLIPRPETETLVEAALQFLQDIPGSFVNSPSPCGRGLGGGVNHPHPDPPPSRGRELLGARILDLGTGSGALALALAQELPGAQIIATDLLPQALAVARENALLNGLEQRVAFLEGDLFGPLEGLSLETSFDLIVSNPPYIPSNEIPKLAPEVRNYEPRRALDGGWDGLKYHRQILHQAHLYLKVGGGLILEIGWNQGPALRDLVKAHTKYGEFKIVQDLQGKDRAVYIKRVR